MLDFVVRVYCGDETELEVGGSRIRMRVESGIRQGCTGSPAIFKLITYKIIRELRSQGRRGGGGTSTVFFRR